LRGIARAQPVCVDIVVLDDLQKPAGGRCARDWRRMKIVPKRARDERPLQLVLAGAKQAWEACRWCEERDARVESY